MSTAHDLFGRRSASDMSDALAIRDEWKRLAERCRSVAEGAQNPSLRLLTRGLAELAEGAANAMAPFCEEEDETSSHIKDLRPFITEAPEDKEWRPGSSRETHAKDGA